MSMFLKILKFFGFGFTNPMEGKSPTEGYTPEIIADMEAKGFDMSEIKKQMQEEANQKAQADKKRYDLLNYAKLQSFVTTPRTDASFVAEVQGLNKSANLTDAEIQNAKLVLAKVVQANSSLYEPDDNLHMPAVYLVLADAQYAFDQDKLTAIVNNIHRDNERGSAGTDAKDFYKKLNNERSSFCMEVPSSLNNGVKAWCFTFGIPYQRDLPEKCLPVTGIIPLLIAEELKPVSGIFSSIEKIAVLHASRYTNL